MSKIIVPQEQQKQIIDLYINKHYGRLKIKKELNLPYGDAVIKRVLKDNGIHIRNFKEAYQAMEKPELRKYPVNDDYCLESHNGAWLLGMIAADGYLPITKGARNRITLTLAAVDEEILHRVAQELQYNGPIYHFDSHGYPSVSLSFASKKIREQMEQYGIVNNKTYKLNKLPDLPKEYLIDFIRGYFDGDGSIFQSANKKISMNFTCASKNFLQEISDFLSKEYNVTNVKVHSYERVHIIYDIRYGKRDSLILGEVFYNNDYISLKRKKDKYFVLKKDCN